VRRTLDEHAASAAEAQGTSKGSRSSFQTKVFAASLSAALIALLVAGLLFATLMRRQANSQIERTLVSEARLAAELLGRSDSPLPQGAAASPAALDREADRIGELLEARVTLVAADGRVVGDSAEPLDRLPTLDNHATRPEIVLAAQSGLGTSRRYSETVSMDMLYAAAAVSHPAIAFVRVGVPLANVREQPSAVSTAVVVALGLALLGAASIAFIVAGRIGQRVRAIAAVAVRYRHGDLTPPLFAYGDDELGTVAQALDDTVHDLGGKLTELSRDRGRIAAILAGMVEGVIVVDQLGRLQLVNHAAQEMLRLDDPPMGRHYVEAIRHPGIASLMTAALSGEQPGVIEIAPPRDPARAVLARAAPTVEGGREGVVLVLHDVTELKHADQVRRDFVANVSHELRTPLTAIRGYVEALEDGDADEAEQKRFLEIIMRHTLRMERLVRDLLRLARLDAGQEALDVGPCDVRGLVQSVLSDLASALEARGQRIDAQIPAGLDPVMGDQAKLHDVLRNLVANASAYAPEQTTVRIVATREDEWIAIDVLDEGPGIPESDLPRVFERFYRVDKSRARDPGGTGLGLAIVKHLIELHGGRVEVKNRETGGAQFTIRLKSGPRTTDAAA
jgi:two-component system phosphate regulon sensor histidine kinase PhoR